VGVPAALARALGLAEGSRVALRALPEAPQAVSVTVEPASEDDWEVVQLNAEYLEEQLLNQVRRGWGRGLGWAGARVG
jgi:peroxin-1